ncbi:MAG: vWA domain-containing protein, partial [Planctomycetota bacterium]
HFKVRLERQGAKLEKDFVFYYRLEDKLPGRVEVVPYRAAKDKPGTFMLVVTPGIDLSPLNNGADYSFVLDISGSMEGKIHTLADGVSRALGQMRPADRFKITAFESRAIDVTRGWQAATPQNVQRAIAQVKGLRSRGSTNLYDGIRLGLKDMDADRATSVVLVTDAVTNTGVVNPKAFHDLMKKFDVRVFGFLMGNSSNWPLMRTIADASGGFYAPVSNQDDIIGQILLAKSKITHECLHDASLKIAGAKVFDAGDELLGKVYRGQQLVIFGRYSEAGRAKVTLKARLTGQDKTYTTSFDFPEVETDNPEIERLWAMDRIERIEVRKNAGLLPAKEAEQAIADLGVSYQLVTDHTSMLVLSDDAFKKHGIERHNRARTAHEAQAQAARRNAPVRNYRVDQKDPAFANPAPRTGGGGGGIGAVDPFVAGLSAMLIALAIGAGCARRRKSGQS